MKLLYPFVIMALISGKSPSQDTNKPTPSTSQQSIAANGYLLTDGKLFLILNSVITEVHRDCTFIHPGLVMRGGMYQTSGGQTRLLLEGDFIDFNGHKKNKKLKIDPRINPSHDRFSATKITGDSLSPAIYNYRPITEVDYRMDPIPAEYQPNRKNP